MPRKGWTPRNRRHGRPLARQLAREKRAWLFRVTVRTPADLNAVEDLAELDLDLLEFARKVPLVAASFLY
jgi:hypothetical protein